MKEVFVERFNEGLVSYDIKFDNDVTITNEFAGKTIISDDNGHCLIVMNMEVLSIQISPVVVTIKNPECEADCCEDCLGHCDKSCDCHEYEKTGEQFDCGGECKQRCFECKNQERINEGEGNDPA